MTEKMFTCQSYLLNPNIIVTSDNLYENIFIDVKNLKEVTLIKDDIDLNYIEGAISLKYLDEEIFGLKDWDLIDQLWSYLIDMVKSVQENDSAKTFFPDQPIRLEMKRVVENQILFSVEANETHKWVLPEKAFFSILLESAYDFFDTMAKLFLEKGLYREELSIIEELKKII